MWGNGGQYFAAVNTNATNAIQAAGSRILMVWGTHTYRYLMVWGTATHPVRRWLVADDDIRTVKNVYMCFFTVVLCCICIHIHNIYIYISWLYHVHCTNCYSTRCVVRCDEHVGHVSRLARPLVGQVYKTYTCEPIETLRGHTNKVPGGSQGEVWFWSVPLDAWKGYKSCVSVSFACFVWRETHEYMLLCFFFAGILKRSTVVKDSVGKWENGERSEFFFVCACVCVIHGFRSCVVSECWFSKL